jgi:hypothetical protein
MAGAEKSAPAREGIMAVVTTLLNEVVEYGTNGKNERYTFTSLNSDTAISITCRWIQKITDFTIDTFGGSTPTSASFTGNVLSVVLPGGTSSPLTGRIKIQGT